MPSLKEIGLFSGFFLFFLPMSISAQVAYIDENNLNVRTGPGTEYDRIIQVNKGEFYEVLAEDAGWIEIELENGSGWVREQYITIQSISETEEVERKELTLESVKIQIDGTHLREGPGAEYNIIAFTEKGSQFDVLSETENWLEITDGKTTGFILKEHLKPSRNDKHVLKDKTIVIDPGHGGRDVGAIGISGSYEKDIAFLTAYELEKELTSLGTNVILTRNGDEFVPLESRTTFANSLDTDVFLSIHYNSFPEMPNVSGIETFYYHDQFQKLAETVHREIVKETNEFDRHVSSKDLHVTRQTFKAGILLELGFLSHQDSEARLQTTGYQKQLVTGIINGLQQYFAAK